MESMEKVLTEAKIPSSFPEGLKMITRSAAKKKGAMIGNFQELMAARMEKLNKSLNKGIREISEINRTFATNIIDSDSQDNEPDTGAKVVLRQE